ncbi:DUF6456 domain-containing protein [Sphingomonas glaciei]|uniref:DUF6456 domain-containing protein n=1 Tax=Sphingomonas glaciei TaxID=2938948 RepID=A0ABY5N0B7_9SPHN|nr:DUF6456 domain-containing protein [Sphingomonas glaciei]UUR09184.1 DUF6456 domain-containing protein [Sphingomonas glaciei]
MAKRLLVEQAVKDGGKVTRGVRRSVTVNQVESPLGWLHRHGHLDRRQFDAGEQLRADWERANLSPCMTMRWDPASASASRQGRCQKLERTELQAIAKARFDDALQAAGTGMSDILWRIVCAGEGMRDAETALGWPARAGKLVLKMALDRVADYYRIR